MRRHASRLTGWQFWLLNGMAGSALLLLAWNISLFVGNRDIQAEVSARQQFINQTIRLSRLNTQLIQALATLSARKDDEEIKALLGAHGLTVTVNQPQSGQAPTQGAGGVPP